MGRSAEAMRKSNRKTMRRFQKKIIENQESLPWQRRGYLREAKR